MSPLFYMLKPRHHHLIYYKNIEWASLEWGHLLSRGAGNKFIQSQSSQGENPCQQDAFCHSLEQEHWNAVRLFLQPVDVASVSLQYLTTLIFTFIQGGNSGSSVKEKKEKRQEKKKQSIRVLPRVELALMRFSCNYFSAITIRTTTTEDLIRQ